MARCRFRILIRELGEDPRKSGENVLRGNVPGVCAVFGQTVEEVLAKASRVIKFAARAKAKRGSLVDLAEQNTQGEKFCVGEIDVEI